MFDKPFVWYVTLALVIVGVVLIGATFWLMFKHYSQKFIFNRFTRARLALEEAHGLELKAFEQEVSFNHNELERRLLIRRLQVLNDDERDVIDDSINTSLLARDKRIADMKAAHAQAHRELELSFGY